MNRGEIQSPWRVIQTRSRAEKKVAGLLTTLGVEVYLPLWKRKRKWSDRVKLVEEPLFSGYLFARFDEARRYPLLNTPGVVRIVSFGGVYASVAEEQIRGLQQLNFLDTEIEVVDELALGQEVLITSGPFRNQTGRLIRSNGRGKLLIEITALGKGIMLELGRTRVVVGTPDNQRLSA